MRISELRAGDRLRLVGGPISCLRKGEYLVHMCEALNKPYVMCFYGRHYIELRDESDESDDKLPAYWAVLSASVAVTML